MIERLADRAERMPRASVVAIWRELMGINLQAQQATHIVIHCPQQPVLVTDQARLGGFGGAAPIVSAGTPQDALDRARNREAIAVIEFSPLSNWWVEAVPRRGADHLRLPARQAKPDRRSGDRPRRRPARHLRHQLPRRSATARFAVAPEAGDKVQTLAICGNLRLCVSQKSRQRGRTHDELDPLLLARPARRSELPDLSRPARARNGRILPRSLGASWPR